MKDIETVLPKVGEEVAVRFVDNLDGQSDIVVLIAYIDHSGSWMVCTSQGIRELEEYIGDEVIEWWSLEAGTGITIK